MPSSRLIVHKFDPLVPISGGIDTCIRGLLTYSPHEIAWNVVGVCANGDTARVGNWESHRFGDNEVQFIPVTVHDPSKKRRFVPDAVRVMLGARKFRKQIDWSSDLQTHRTDIAAVLKVLMPKNTRYAFVHTQRHGLTSTGSDSLWRPFGKSQELVDRFAVEGAEQVWVFNEDFAGHVRTWNHKTRFSPTWFDPQLISHAPARNEDQIVWVGRFEQPKDPLLAVTTFNALCTNFPTTEWTMTMIGSGSLSGQVDETIASLPPHVGRRITRAGQLQPQHVMNAMGKAGALLMTSHPGYEGFPRVLVEGLASGLPAVVTKGTDTGNLINGSNGFKTTRDPEEIARCIAQTKDIDRDGVRNSVTHLSAPVIVSEILGDQGRVRQQ